MRGKMRESRYCQWKVVAAAVAVVSEVTTVQVRSGKKFTLLIKKMGNPWPLFYFCLFKQSLQFLQQINLKKCPSGIRCWDLNT